MGAAVITANADIPASKSGAMESPGTAKTPESESEDTPANLQACVESSGKRISAPVLTPDR